MATMLVYMVNELGRRAAEEMNMPVLNSSNPSVRRPVLAPKCLHIPLKPGKHKTVNLFYFLNVHI